MEQTDPNKFKTHDFYLAAYMMYLGFDVSDQSLIGTKTILYFTRNAETFPEKFKRIHPSLYRENSPYIKNSLQEIAQDYQNSEYQRLLESYRRIKDIALPRQRA